MDDTLSRDELDRILAKVFKLDTSEKLAIHRALIEIFNAPSDIQTKVSQILVGIDDAFAMKADQVLESIDNKSEAQITGKISPIFRRVTN